MYNECVEIVEDTDYLLDNPGEQVWNVGTKVDPFAVILYTSMFQIG